MELVFGAIAALLGVLLFWGFVAPRSLWRVIEGWTVVDAHRHEPGGGSYMIRRLLCLLGLVGLATVWGLSTWAQVSYAPRTAPPPSAVERMWGSPEPHIVNRVVATRLDEPTGLVRVPALGYQTIDPDIGPPQYLIDVVRYSRLGDGTPDGIIGSYPGDGYTAMSTATMLVHVRGPILCMPRDVVVIESDDEVQIGVYFGLPDNPAGLAVDHVVGCPEDSALTESLLIPIQLADEVGDRKVVNLDGTAVDRVRVIE